MRQVAYNPVPRWRDRPTGGASDEDRASALARSSLVPGALPDGLSALQLARIEQNLKGMEMGTRASRPSRLVWRLRLAFASLVLVATAVSLMALQTGWLSRRVAQDEPPAGPRGGQAPVVPPAEPPPLGAETAGLAEQPLAAAGAPAESAAAEPRPSMPPGAPAGAGPAPARRPPAAVSAPSGAATGTWSSDTEDRATMGSEAARAIPQRELASGAPAPAVMLPLPLPAPATVPAAAPAVASEPVRPLAPGSRATGPSPAVASTAPRVAKQAAGLRRGERIDATPPAAASPAGPASGSPELIRAAQEILALDHALALLRKPDAQGALQALDDYLARFPAGVLGHEARVARVDALLALRRSEEALLALEVLPLDEHRRAAELQVVRGELRSRGDCLLAERDFSAALARVCSATLEERALYGRASCRNKRGDIKGATDDFRRYLERFPKGRHAAWARRWLENAD